ncbi:actin-domain-containing protein [Agrocybe pediades]|nr:actin-domain-containing protein [Agrocybe pediades]
MSHPIVILDTGASTVKAGLVGRDLTPKIVPNAVVRSKGDKMTYFGHEIEQCQDYSSLHYRLPFEKGYLVDWDAQKAVWDGIFSDQVLGVDTSRSSLLITEPYFNLPNIQEVYDQLIFEEYEFVSYHRCTPASVVPYGPLFSQPGLAPPDCMIVVDSGFSFTHVIPMIDGEIIWDAVRRLDVGGKLLTNQLKELVSYRQWNMMDETYIMNLVKESCCFVSTNYKEDIETCRVDLRRNPIVQEYVLPDLATSHTGRVRQKDDIITETDQILVMNNERFTVPELLFHPEDIGLEQGGLPFTVANVISLLPTDLQGMFWANIGIVGGNAKFPGFHERIFSELRALAPADYEVVVHTSEDPITEVYHSAYKFALQSDFAKDHVVTRAEYEEHGSLASFRKFRDWRPLEELEKDRDNVEAESASASSEKAVPVRAAELETEEEGEEEEEEEEEEEPELPPPFSKTRMGKQAAQAYAQKHPEFDDRSQAPSAKEPPRTRSLRSVAGTSAASTTSATRRI